MGALLSRPDIKNKLEAFRLPVRKITGQLTGVAAADHLEM
jgi:hypothetical protein